MKQDPQPNARKNRGARKLALDVLFEHEVGGAEIEAVLQRHSRNPVFPAAETLVRGVNEHVAEIDSLIAGNSVDWPLSRMPPVDRTLLRLALFEILHGGRVNAAIAINEAVELAKIYSTEDSSRFINGILGAVVKKL
ncbi:MAG: transcription antitermination factor NusB [Actinomycetota bacterium]